MKKLNYYCPANNQFNTPNNHHNDKQIFKSKALAFIHFNVCTTTVISNCGSNFNVFGYRFQFSSRSHSIN